MTKALAKMDDLRVEQRNALELLLAGKSLAETARTAGIGRTTLYRWLKEDNHYGDEVLKVYPIAVAKR